MRRNIFFCGKLVPFDGFLIIEWDVAPEFGVFLKSFFHSVAVGIEISQFVHRLGVSTLGSFEIPRLCLFEVLVDANAFKIGVAKTVIDFWSFKKREILQNVGVNECGS